MVSQNDLVYAISSQPNRLWVFDSSSLQTVADISLPDVPAKIHLENGQLLISFPNLKYIGYYNAATLALEKTLSLPNIVSSFEFYKGYLFYTEDYELCHVFRTELSTMKTVEFSGGTSGLFLSPELVINAKDDLVYIIDCYCGGGKAYLFDPVSMVQKTVTSGYGFSNYSRHAFFDGSYLYFSNFKCDRLNTDHILCEYDIRNSCPGILYVDNTYLITCSIIFDKHTSLPIYSFDEQMSNAVITKSGHVILSQFYIPFLYIIPKI